MYRSQEIDPLVELIQAECPCPDCMGAGCERCDDLGADPESLKTFRAFVAERDAEWNAELDRMKVHISEGLGIPVDQLPGFEASIVALAVEAKLVRRTKERA